jgi:hypothetical protein
MNCAECKNLTDAFLDNELDEQRASEFATHIAVCETCARYCGEVSSFLDACASETPSELVPPNSRALWCRINNIIESEQKTEPPSVELPRGRWRFSFWQVAGAVICVALISSILTIVAVSRYVQPGPDDLTMRSSAQSLFDKALGRIGLVETPQQARERRLKEQQAAIEYWNARVQARREQWDRMTRDAFDRNLRVIDESVNEYTLILQQDPEDELSGEMLDSVLNDKMNLLRDFSDL